MPCTYNEFGAIQICDDGCEHLCDECHAELAGDLTAGFINISSGEDAPIAYEISHAKKETILSL